MNHSASVRNALAKRDAFWFLHSDLKTQRITGKAERDCRGECHPHINRSLNTFAGNLFVAYKLLKFHFLSDFINVTTTKVIRGVNEATKCPSSYNM